MKKRDKKRGPTIPPDVARELLDLVTAPLLTAKADFRSAVQLRVQLELIGGRGDAYAQESMRQSRLWEKICGGTATPFEQLQHQEWLQEKYERHTEEVRAEIAKGIDPWTHKPKQKS